MHAIPTRYAGVQFRSRLEARWAAFFDLCQWKWEYEPCDLAGWIPDFRLHGADGRWALVEVKPAAFLEEVGDHCDMEKMWSVRTTDPTVEWILLLGSRPFDSIGGITFHVMLGFALQMREGCCYAAAMTGEPKLRELSFALARPCFFRGSTVWPYQAPDMAETVELLWREAGNRVQWRGPAATP